MKTGRRWGDTATAGPRRPPEGAQPCSTCRPPDGDNQGPLPGCPRAPGQALRGETALRASWTMRGDPTAACHLPRVLGLRLTSQRVMPLASQPPSSPEGVRLRRAQQAFRAGRGGS